MKTKYFLGITSLALLALAACASDGDKGTADPAEGIAPLAEIDATRLGNDEALLAEKGYAAVGMPDEVTDNSVSIAWPGSGIATRFTGSQLLATISGTEETWLDVEINDVSKPIQLTPGRFAYRLIDAEPGTYDVRLRIRTDRPYSPVVFEGFDPVEGTLAAPAPNDLQMLVIGDDVAAGYGIEGDDRTCKYTRATQNANLSFAAIAAETLDADLATIARSGRGLTRNWDNDSAPTMADFYAEIQKDAPGMLAGMDIVIIHLGMIDIAQEDLAESFKPAYQTLLSEVRSDSPDALIVAGWGPMGRKPQYEPTMTAISEAVAARTASGDDNVMFVEFENAPDGQFYGCDWHPSADTQRFMGEVLATAIAEKLGLDDGLLGG